MSTDYSDVVQLLRRVPLPPEGDPFEGAGDTQIAAIADKYDHPLPDEYVRWLRAVNGSMAGPGGIYGVQTARDFLDALEVLRLNPGWEGRGWIPVAGDGNGNTYVLDVSRRYVDANAIYFVDSMNGDDVT